MREKNQLKESIMEPENAIPLRNTKGDDFLASFFPSSTSEQAAQLGPLIKKDRTTTAEKKALKARKVADHWYQVFVMYLIIMKRQLGMPTT